MKENKGIERIGNNIIIGRIPEKAKDVEVSFSGSNNILFVSEEIKGMKNSKIHFKGDNALVYLSKNINNYVMHIEVGTDSCLFVGENVYMNPAKAIKTLVEDREQIFIGDDCLFSLGIVLETKGKGDIFIGNRVWLAQGVKINGGSVVENGAILGAMTKVYGQTVKRNTCVVTKDGNLKNVLENVIFEKTSIRNTPAAEVQKHDSIDPYTLKSIKAKTENDMHRIADTLKRTIGAEEKEKFLEAIKGRKTYSLAFRLCKKIHRITVKPSNPKEKKAKPIYGENIIEGNYDEDKNNITFKGKGNRLIIEEGAELNNCRIIFHGDNGLLYLGKSEVPYRMVVGIHCDCTVFVGENSKTKQSGRRMSIVTGEGKNVVIGKNVSFGADVWLRSSDQHGIYDCKTLKRTNPPKSIVVGSDNSIPDGTLVLKGQKIGTGEKDASLIKLMEDLDSTTDMDERVTIIKEYKSLNKR